MRARRLILSAGIAGSALVGALTAHGTAVLAAPSDVGSWGQAWGDDSTTPPPEPAAPQRPRATVPSSPMPVTAPAATMRPMPQGPSANQIGGWGDAWGSEATPATTPPRPRASVPTVTPVAPAAPMTPMPNGPSPAEIGGWGDAWGTDAPAAPAVARPVPPVSAQMPVSAQAPAPAQEAPAAAQPQARPATSNAPSSGVLGAVMGGPVADDAGQDQSEPVQMTADQIVHDRELGIVTARGRVEIIQNNRTLVADQVSYNLKQDIVSASGNVILAEANGETVSANYFELTGDLKEGVANQIRSILADRSSLSAATGRRVAGDRTDFEDGTYTACEPCRSHPEREPLWQAKAKRITHNQAERNVEYRDLWMELGGVPVFYTPYLSHPDPTVKRKSGFLTPTAGQSSTIGTNLTVPYFWAIKDNQDITFAPRFLFPSSSTKNARDLDETDSALRHVVLAGEHRWRGAEGEERTIASLTADKYSGDLRGHINSRARFDLDQSWRAGYQLERSSDDTYTAIYSYRMSNDRPWLTTRPYVEGFGRRNYTMAEAFAYQGLRADDSPEQSPIVLPHITTSRMTAPDSRGGYYTYDADVLAYGRSEGTNSTRLSNRVGWQRPYMGSFGDITTVSTGLRADAYHSDTLPEVGSANSGRVVPEVATNWRMPFARPSRSMPQVLEPMAMVAASPNGGNPSKIPNEDAIGFELDETNIYRPNRLPGLDRVEGGVRGAYGLRWHAYPGNNSWMTAAVAQGWRAHADDTFRPGSGFEDTLSDYVARFDVSPSPNLALLNRMRLDRKTAKIRRNENTLSVGSPILRADVSYIMFERADDTETQLDRRHATTWTLTSALTRYWSMRGGVSYDLTDGTSPTSWNARLVYDDECFAFVSEMKRNYTYDRDYLAGYSVTVNVVFKTLGSIPFNVF